MPQFVVIQQAVETVLGQLERLPPSSATEGLRARLQDCAQDIEMWSASWPSPRELDLLMNRVLVLHAEATRLERGAPLAEGDSATA
jgi:hypothetical protein